MVEHFDPYHRWLGIPPEEQPPDHYRLLGIPRFEALLEVIEAAADRQKSHLRSFQSGTHADLAEALLNEVAAARVTLLNPEEKAVYDAWLRREMQRQVAGSGTLAERHRSERAAVSGRFRAVVLAGAALILAAATARVWFVVGNRGDQGKRAAPQESTDVQGPAPRLAGPELRQGASPSGNVAGVAGEFPWIEGAILAYSFDDESRIDRNCGLVVRDLTGHGYDLRFLGAGLDSRQDGTCVTLDGERAWAKTVGDGPQIRGAFTACLLMKLDGDGPPGKEHWTLLNRNRSANAAPEPFHFFVRSKTKSLCVRFGNGVIADVISSPVRISDGDWHFAAVVFDPQGHKFAFYVDDYPALEKTVPASWVPGPGDGPLTLGVWLVYKNYFCGSLDEVAIWNRNLTGAEIRSMYQYYRDGKSYCRLIAGRGPKSAR